MPLTDELKLKIHLTDTIMPNGKYFPAAIKELKFLGKSTVAYKRNNTLLCAKAQTSCNFSYYLWWSKKTIH